MTSARTPDADQQVHDRIYQAILERQLPPGTKLPEERLAAIFGVSRARIRKVLGRLEVERIIEVVPNRGAFIAQPSFEETEDIFEARLALEPAVVRRLTKRAGVDEITALRSHVAEEFAARDRDDKQAMLRLTGEFHNLAADLAGNAAMARPMRELSALTCLAILLYEQPSTETCRADEHLAIVELVEAGDVDRAVEAMVAHLDAARRSLTFERKESVVDLDAVFG